MGLAEKLMAEPAQEGLAPCTILTLSDGTKTELTLMVIALLKAKVLEAQAEFELSSQFTRSPFNKAAVV